VLPLHDPTTPHYGDLIDSSEASSEHNFDWIPKSGKRSIFSSGQQVGAGIAAQNAAGAQATTNAELSIRGFQEEGETRTKARIKAWVRVRTSFVY
jgi:hypothetical protein